MMFVVGAFMLATLSCSTETKMQLTLMKAKLHRAAVTQADLHYEGSIGIDRELMDAAGILPHERVEVWNVTNGARFATYAIAAPRGGRAIAVNGAAARQVQKGDRLIITTFALLSPAEAEHFEPTVLILDEDNRVKEDRSVIA